jgi:hypothetical protein
VTYQYVLDAEVAEGILRLPGSQREQLIAFFACSSWTLFRKAKEHTKTQLDGTSRKSALADGS